MTSKKLIATVAVGIAVAPGLVVYGATNAASAATKAHTAAAPSAAAGKKLFEATCKTCHGAKGEGTALDKNMAYSKLQRAKTIKGVVEQLTKPINGMPSFNTKYKKNEKEELGAYVVTLSK